MSYENFKDLARIPASDKLMCDNEFAIVTNSKYEK